MLKHFLVAAVLATSPALASAATIVNGSFETGNYVNEGYGFDRLTLNSTDITGWTVLNDTVVWVGTFWQAADGALSLDLSGDIGAQGSIGQTITDLIVGTVYDLSFAMSGHPAAVDPKVKSLTVDVGGTSETFTYDIGGNANSYADMKWQERTFRFTATGTSALLKFTANDSTGYGAALDNVSIAQVGTTPIPVPAALPLLLAGLGGLALLRQPRTL